MCVLRISLNNKGSLDLNINKNDSQTLINICEQFTLGNIMKSRLNLFAFPNTQIHVQLYF